jgi:hypothetical protein
MNRHSLMRLALLLSLAFNLGFGASVAVHRYMGGTAVAEPPTESTGFPHRLRVLSDQLAGELKPLRREQATLTRKLTTLIAEPEPDRGEIDRCLDDISSTGRRVQGAVVEAILEQKDQLPEGERAAFCLEVHRGLCESWSRSGFESDCCPKGCARNNKQEGTKE